MASYLHISLAVADDCINLMESYGEICVKCNACGRFDKSTQKQAELDLYKRRLKEMEKVDEFVEGYSEIQKKNRKENIEYLKSKISELEKGV